MIRKYNQIGTRIMHHVCETTAISSLRLLWVRDTVTFPVRFLENGVKRGFVQGPRPARSNYFLLKGRSRDRSRKFRTNASHPPTGNCANLFKYPTDITAPMSTNCRATSVVREMEYHPLLTFLLSFPLIGCLRTTLCDEPCSALSEPFR